MLADYEPEEMLDLLSMSVTRILNLAGNMVKGLPSNILEIINEVLNKIPAKQTEVVKENIVAFNFDGKEVKLNMPEGYYNVNYKIKHLVKNDFVKAVIDTLIVVDSKKKFSPMLKGIKFFFIKQFKISTLLNKALKENKAEMLVMVNEILIKINK